MWTLLYDSKWHQYLPSQAQSKELDEDMLSKLVRKPWPQAVLGTWSAHVGSPAKMTEPGVN